MALTINTTITTQEGIEISNTYGRVSVADQKWGKSLQCGLDIYASEAAFLAGLESLNLPSLAYAEVAYDRTTESTDILDVAHDALIAQLAAVGIDATKNL